VLFLIVLSFPFLHSPSLFRCACREFHFRGYDFILFLVFIVQLFHPYRSVLEAMALQYHPVLALPNLKIVHHTQIYRTTYEIKRVYITKLFC
jgi:hypothetical protein